MTYKDSSWSLKLAASLPILFVIVGLAYSVPVAAGCSHAKDGCAPIFDPCCGSMACEITAWPPECRHRPPRENEACTIFSGCGGNDLYCQGFQDGLAGRCRKYAKLGEACDGVITLCGDKLNCVQDPRALPPVLHLGEGRCFPEVLSEPGHPRWSPTDNDICLNSYSASLHRSLPWGTGAYGDVAAVSTPRAISFGRGYAATAVAGLSIEEGGVYGTDGSYGCYHSECFVDEASVGVSGFVSIGQYREYEDASGISYGAHVGGAVFVGASRGVAWDIDPRTIDPSDPLYEPQGDLFNLTIGLDVEVGGGVSVCTTTVNTVVKNWNEITEPDARCADRNVCAEGPVACSAAASINDGSTVPGGGPPTLEQIPPGPYQIGETEVTLMVTAADGASDTCSALVDVLDCTPPALTCRETVAECQHERMAFVEPLPPLVEDCTAHSMVGPPAGDYALGDTSVTFEVTDAYLNASSCDTRIRVVDTQPPKVISASARPAVLWPPNHKMQRIEIQMEAVDACDPDASCVVREIESSDPDHVWWRRKDQAGDTRIVGPSTIELRAERSGDGNSRTYTVHFECADTTAGNVSRGQVQVVVPHDQARK